MTAAALARQLPPTMQITWVNGRDSRDADLFFGGVAPPSAYAFNLSAAVPEPRLMVDTDTDLFLGHAVRGLERQSTVPGCSVFTCRCPSWAVCFSITISGGKASSELEPFLLPAIAARHGVFAHPVATGAQASGAFGVRVPVQPLFLYEPVRGGCPGAAGQGRDGGCRQHRMSARARFPHCISPTARRSKPTCSSTARGPMRGCCHAWVWKSQPAGGCEQH